MRIFLLIAIGFILGITANTPFVMNLSLTVSQTLQSFQPSWFINLSIAISLVEFGLIIAIPLISLYAWVTGHRYLAAFFFLSGLAWLIVRFLKSFFGEICPAPPAIKILFPFFDFAEVVNRTDIGAGMGIITREFCYPSGHVFEYVTFFGLIWYFRRVLIKNLMGQKLLGSIALAMMIGVGPARVSLGSHWVTDVIGGYVFGLAWLLILITVYKRLS